MDNFDSEPIVGELISQVLSSNSNSQTKNRNGTKLEDKAIFSNAKTDLYNLMEVQALLDKKVDAEKQEADDLLLRVSPLMSFDDKLFAKLASYQDEASLFEPEHAMAMLLGEDPDVVDSAAFTSQWEFLEQHRQFSSNFIDSGPRDRCLGFVQASKYA